MAMSRRTVTASVVLATTGFGMGAAAQQPPGPVRLIAANAVKDGLEQLAKAFEQQTGQRVEVIWSGTEASARRIAAGELFDAVLIGSDAIQRLADAGHVQADSRVAFARTGVALAVRGGYPPPTIDTPEAVKAAVLAAPRVAYSAGPSGVYVDGLMVRFGIAEQVRSKTAQPLSGAEVAKLLERQEVDLAFAQVSEFMNVPGIQPLGPLPASIQNYTTYTIAQTRRPAVHPGVSSFAAFIASDKAKEAVERMGMEQPRQPR